MSNVWSKPAVKPQLNVSDCDLIRILSFAPVFAGQSRILICNFAFCILIFNFLFDPFKPVVGEHCKVEHINCIVSVRYGGDVRRIDAIF